ARGVASREHLLPRRHSGCRGDRGGRSSRARGCRGRDRSAVNRVRPFGEAAFLVEVEDPEAAQGLRRGLMRQPVDGVAGFGPGGGATLVESDPLVADAGALESALASVAPMPANASRERVIAVVYDGPDLAEVAELLGLTEATVVETHVAAKHRVLFGG